MIDTDRFLDLISAKSYTFKAYISGIGAADWDGYFLLDRARIGLVEAIIESMDEWMIDAILIEMGSNHSDENKEQALINLCLSSRAIPIHYQALIKYKKPNPFAYILKSN